MVGDELNRILVEVAISVRVIGNEVPIRAPVGIPFDEEGLPADGETLTDIATGIIMDMMNRRDIHTLVFEDNKHNKIMIPVDQIQSISVLAPKDYDPSEYTSNDPDD